METIKVKVLSEVTGMNSRLEFKISGINNTIINCIRRSVMTSIPVFSFNNITISENTSIFNNNYIKLRLRNIPVFGITTDDPIFIKKVENLDVIEEETNADILNDMDMNNASTLNSSSLKQLTMYVDKTNTTSEIINVTTDDCKFYYMEKQIDSPYKLPKCNNIPLIKLQPTQKIKLSAITELGIEELDGIYSAVSIFAFKYIDDLNYDVAIESRGQLDERTIIEYGIINLNNLLDKFIGLIPDVSIISGKLLVDDADHTIGTIIAEGLQNHKMIKFAGYNMPHPLDNKILIHYELVKETNIKDILSEIVEDYKKIFNKISKLIKI
jgi:DNA-directed RNA polymerase subunit L